MIVLHLKRRYQMERHEFPDGDLKIGTEDGLPLPGLGGHYCTLRSRAVGCLIVDTSGKTLVNGKPISGVRALYKEDLVEVGDYRMIVEHFATTLDPVEERLLQDIRGNDQSARLVYADWLEENGDTRRAMLLRTQEELLALDPGDFEYQACAERLAQLTVAIDHRWRLMMARGRVAGCFVEGCAMDWGMLDEIEDVPYRRRCRGCGETVGYCELLGDATSILRRGGRVVVDGSIVFDPAKLDITIVR